MEQTLEQRCKVALECLPDARYRTMLGGLFDELLARAAVPAHLVQQPTSDGWISVEERMPEPGTECLVWCREAVPGFGPFPKVDTWDEQHEAPVSWSTATIPVGLGWNDSDFDDVTHWRPLAAPQAEAQQEQPDSVHLTEHAGQAATARDAPHDPLRQAAEQFLASCQDGNVRELVDYYEEIFREALAASGVPACEPSMPPGSVDEMLEWIESMTDDAPIANMARAARVKLASGVQETELWQCTQCGRIGSVGRCCGLETRRPYIAGAKTVDGEQR